jgi:hypothetical protein
VHFAPIRQGHECPFPLCAGAKIEEAREQAETPRGLAAPDLAVAVDDGVLAIALKPARLYSDRLETFA